MLRQREQSGPLELSDLEAFLKVAETQSFTAAAERMGVPKSTVSRRVSRLEATLGVQLVHRTTRRLALTDTGLAFYERASAALAGLDEAAEAVRAQRSMPRGHLRVTAPMDIGVAVLGSIVTEFTCTYPEVTVDVLLTDRTLDLVAEGIDVAIRASASLPDSSLVARRLGVSDAFLFASPSYVARRGAPRSVHDLAAHDAVLLRASRGHRLVRLVDPEGREHEVMMRARVSANDFFFLRRAALDGAGIAPLPLMLCAAELREGLLVPVLEGFSAGRAGIYLVHPGTRLISAKVRAFWDFVVAHFEERPFGRA